MSGIIVSCPACSKKNRLPAEKADKQPKCGNCGTSLVITETAAPVEIDDASFDRVVLESPVPVLVDFYSPTCGPCQEMFPVLDRIAKSYAGRALVAKVNAPENMQVSVRYGIRGVPVLIFFEKGETVKKFMGAQSEVDLTATLDSLL